MKKHILLFVILLAMFVDALGQNTPTLLWEQKLETINENQIQTNGFGSCGISKGSSTTATTATSASLIFNLELETQAKIRAFDTNGNLIWKFPFIFLSKNGYYGTEGYRYTTTFLYGINSNSLLFNDTLSKLDNELRFVTPVSRMPFDYSQDEFRIDEEDGYILNDAKTNEIVKTDLTKKEIWRYKLDADMKFDNITITRTKIGYSIVSSLSDPNYKISYVLLTLDKTGKKISKIIKKSPVKCGKMTLTSDGGFWVQNYIACSSIASSEMIRYDSTNKEILRIDPYYLNKRINRNDASFIRSKVNGDGYEDSPLGITPNGALIFGFFTGENVENPKSFFFVKIDGVSKDITTEEIDMKSRGFSELPSAIRIVDDNKFLFVGEKKIIGGADFATKNSIWADEVSFKGNLLYYSYSPKIIGNVFPVIKNDSLKCYGIDGKVKWAKANTYQYDSFGFNNYSSDTVNYLYSIKDSVTTKIRINDGKILWSLKLKPSKIIIDDIDGNSYRYQEETTYIPFFSRKYIINCISKLGKISKIYESPNVDFNQYGHPVMGFSYTGSIYKIDYKNKFFYAHALEKQPDGTYQFIYRKYSTRCAYDLEAIAEATGKTEVCSGTKVKLSTPKQDGLTYQWQKDGKDIPSFKDVVHDVEESGTYTVIVKDEICQNQTISNLIRVTIKPSPEAIIKVETKGVSGSDFTVKMTANIGMGLNYQWLKNDSLIANATTSMYEAKKSGTYAVRINQEGCTKTSEPLVLNIQIPLGVLDEVGEVAVKIYPNPSRGNFNVLLPQTLKGAVIQLFDHYGRERVITHTNEQIQAEGLMQGIYFLKITKGGKVVTNKIMIE